MRPETVGRALGIGLRVAGRIAGQRIGAASGGEQHVPARGSEGMRFPADSRPNPAGRSARGSLARGIAGLLGPLRRVGGTLWLEVIGVFFFLPVVVFAPTLWRTRSSFAHGPDHRTFVASAVLVAVFLYLGISSFWRARRRSVGSPTSAPK
jgi:hypothetical protein